MEADLLNQAPAARPLQAGPRKAVSGSVENEGRISGSLGEKGSALNDGAQGLGDANRQPVVLRSRTTPTCSPKGLNTEFNDLSVGLPSSCSI